MVSYLFGLESMAYLTCGLVDAGVPDYSLESAICKVSGTEFLWYAANRALQLKGGAGYMRDEPYEKVLRDIRIFPIFEGANDVLRAFIALTGMKPLGEQAVRARRASRLADPIGSLGRAARLRRRPDPARGAAGPDHQGARRAVQARPSRSPSRSSGCARSPSRCCASTASGIVERQFHQKRLADAVADIYARWRVLSRVTSILEDQGVEPSGQELYIAETFCTRAAGARARRASTRSSTTTTSDGRDRQARLQARRIRLRAVRRLDAERTKVGAFRASRTAHLGGGSLVIYVMNESSHVRSDAAVRQTPNRRPLRACYGRPRDLDGGLGQPLDPSDRVRGGGGVTTTRPGERIAAEVESWPGVNAGAHRFGGVGVPARPPRARPPPRRPDGRPRIPTPGAR